MTSWRETGHCVLRNQHRTACAEEESVKNRWLGREGRLRWFWNFTLVSPHSQVKEGRKHCVSSQLLSCFSGPVTGNQADIFCIQSLNNGVWFTNLFSFQVGKSSHSSSRKTERGAPGWPSSRLLYLEPLVLICKMRVVKPLGEKTKAKDTETSLSTVF